MLEKNDKTGIQSFATSFIFLLLAFCFLPVATRAQSLPSEIFGEYTGETQITITMLDISRNVDGVTVELKDTGAENDYILQLKGLDILGYFEIPIEMDYVTITPIAGGYRLSKAEPITIIIPEVTLPPIPILLPSGGTFYNVSSVTTLENSQIVNDILKVNIKVAISGILPIIPIVVNIAFEGALLTSSITTTAKIAPMKVYPNPTTGEFSVFSDQFSVEGIEIFDVYGKKLQSKIVNLQSEIVIDISHLPEGVYLLKIQTEKGIQTQKVIKKGQ